MAPPAAAVCSESAILLENPEIAYRELSVGRIVSPPDRAKFGHFVVNRGLQLGFIMILKNKESLSSVDAANLIGQSNSFLCARMHCDESSKVDGLKHGPAYLQADHDFY